MRALGDYLRSTVPFWFCPVLLAGVAAGTQTAEAQSFDCKKASTEIEKQICGDPALGRLDEQLEHTFRERLAADRAHRENLLADERAWVAQRDNTCSMAKAGLDDCLAKAYRERLASLAAPADPGRTAICEAIGRKYQSLAAAPAGKTPLDPDAVLRDLANAPSSGVSVAPAAVEDVDPGKLADWAKAQHPPFAIPADLIEAIRQNTDSRQTLEHLPATGFYAANGTAGTLYCYQPGVYFRVENGVAKMAAAPTGWTGGEGDGCLVTRSVGMVDATPVTFEESQNAPEIGSYTLNVTPWQGSGFGAQCTAMFRFSQRFGAMDKDDPNYEADSCTGGNCGRLEKAVQDLVRNVQANAQSVRSWRDQQVAALTPDQAKQYRAMMAAPGKPGENVFKSAASLTADRLTVDAPLFVPLVDGGQVYLAKVGHLTFRDVVRPGWKISLRHPADGSPGDSDLSSFDVQMTSDRLIDATAQ